jgi:hypothetical protein
MGGSLNKDGVTVGGHPKESLGSGWVGDFEFWKVFVENKRDQIFKSL